MAGRPQTYVKVHLQFLCGHQWNGFCQEKDVDYWQWSQQYECADCLNAKDEKELSLVPLVGTYMERHIAGRQRKAIMDVLADCKAHPTDIANKCRNFDILRALQDLSRIDECAWWIANCLCVPRPSTIRYVMRRSRMWRPLKPGKQTYISGVARVEHDADALELERGENG